MPSSHADGGRLESRYYYRRDLTARELLGPVAIGAGVGLAVFYLARVLLQRTPLPDGEGRASARVSRGDRPITPRRT